MICDICKTSGMFVVVTSIQDYTDAVKRYSEMQNWHVIYVADAKTPKLKKKENITVLTVAHQKDLGYQLIQHSPYNHYCRKNIGYLFAMEQGASFIIDTDDDNYPYNEWENIVDYDGPIRTVRTASVQPTLINVYRYFTDQFIWPRGMPLSAITNNGKVEMGIYDGKVAIWQGLVNNNPDVDAIYRLLYGPDVKLQFEDELPVVLERGGYCPFNSQNTLWKKVGFPLMYLPSFVNFRFTDILRSYIAQRCLWVMNLNVGFLYTTAYQERNEHDLLADFEDEIPCYLNAPRIISIIESLDLSGNPIEDLHLCYDALTEEGITEEKEIRTVKAWLTDIKRIQDVN